MKHYMPTRLITGSDSISQSAALLSALGERCLVVTGKSSAKKCGALDDVTAALDAQGVAWTVYDGVCQNPTVDSCAEGGAAAREFGADFLVGVGGGSPLDATKAISVLAANPGLSEADLYAGRWPNGPKPYVLVGTTAGTGSEVTAISVLTGADGRKRGLKSERLYAALSFGDAKYTMTLPRAFTLSTGVDALSHCIESYFSRKADALTRAFAARGARLLVPALAEAADAEDAADLSPALRARLYDASILGGLAINTTGTTVPHNVGYYLTEQYHVAHGTACGVFQPALLAHMKRAVPETAAAFYAETCTDEDALLTVLRRALPPLDIRMTEEELAGQMPRWENSPQVANALGDFTPAQIREMLTELFVK